MDSYTFLAEYYDELTSDVGHAVWAEYISEIFRKHETRVETVLDLACGTGALSFALADIGYDLISVDNSGEMLAVAYQKVQKRNGKPMFIQQDITELDLYGTVDAAVCCLDSVNYLLSASDFEKMLGRLKFFVRPGGIFIFDVNTDKKYKSMNGNVFIRDLDNIFCVWSADYNMMTRLCEMKIDLFKRRGELWERQEEKHTQYAHADVDLRKALEKSGFTLSAAYDELGFSPVNDESERVFYVARRREE